MMTAEIIVADGTAQRGAGRSAASIRDELEYFKNGGILHYVLRNLAQRRLIWS